MPHLKPSILIVDDELSVQRSLSIVLKHFGPIIASSSGDDALKKFNENKIDLVVLDVRLPKISGIEILKKIKTIDEHVAVIMITAVNETRTAVEAMKLGAYDYITKPFDVGELKALVEKALEKTALIRSNIFLRSEMSRMHAYDELIGKSKELKTVLGLIDRAASSDTAVLICGESGTGKELIARAIHNGSKRANNPFIIVNCAAIPDNLLESELFGHEAGAFTGAMERKEGKFEAASGGTIFLDEIGSMPPNLQAKMLRVLQENKYGAKEIERVGALKPIQIDVRVISATNMDLLEKVEDGKFRQDLYYRLNVLPINVPPLRTRSEDIPLLVRYFLDAYNKRLHKHVSGFNKEAMNALAAYAWPGNIRELKNIIERVVTLNQKGEVSPGDLPAEVISGRHKNIFQEEENEQPISVARDKLEAGLIRNALKKTGGNKVKASKLLGMHRNTLASKIDQLGLNKHSF